VFLFVACYSLLFSLLLVILFVACNSMLLPLCSCLYSLGLLVIRELSLLVVLVPTLVSGFLRTQLSELLFTANLSIFMHCYWSICRGNLILVYYTLSELI
jgi:hypothetical protein